jgi:tetratricopeptide (TPR) repeat protein
MADIFISYTSSDREWAHWIAGELTAQGHTPHVHEWEIAAGGDIYAWMEKRHDAADHVLCVVSDEYLKAPYSTLERNAALWQATSNRPGFVIFVVVKPCRLPTLTDHIRRCELFGIDRDEARRRLADFMATREAPKGFVFPGQVYALSNIPVRMPEHFLGRDDALAAIDEGLKRYKGRIAVVALHGLRGVGKTTLAAAYADRHRAEYRATWWIRAQTPEGMRADLVALGLRLGWVAADAAEDAALARVLERLANEGQGILLIYDNALDAASLRPFLPKGGEARVLVTSNTHAWRGLASPVEIRLWPKEIGADYFLARTGREERDAAEQLSDALGGLPLAHEQAAAYCERLSVSLSDYLKRFSAQPERLLDDARHAPADYHDGLTVAKTFGLAIAEAAKLHPAAGALLAHAAILPPEPIPLFLFRDGHEALDEPLKSGLAADGFDEALAALASFALIERQSVTDERDPAILTECFRLHRLVRQVADANDSGRSGRAKALIRALKHIYPPDAFDQPQQWSRCRRMRPIIFGFVETETDDISGVELDLASLLHSVGSLDLYLLAANERTRVLIERALSIREKLLGPEHPDVATNLNSLGGVLLRVGGDLPAARAHFERALAIREKVLGPDHQYTAASLGNLATATMHLGDLSGARPLYERALALQERVLGADHPDTATVVHNLAGLLYVMGDYTASRATYERALAIRDKMLGPDHPATTTTIHNLARLLHAVGDLAAARRMAERAVETYERTLGPAHPQTSVALSTLGLVLAALGDRAEARRHFERALAIDEAEAGADGIQTSLSLSNLGRVLMEADDFDGARPLLERAMAIREKVLGPHHHDTASAVNDLGELFERKRDFAAALPLFERALAIFAAAVGNHHSNTNRQRYNIASVLLADSRPGEALPLAQGALAGHAAALGEGHAFTKESAGLVVQALTALGRDDEAAAVTAKYGANSPSP